MKKEKIKNIVLIMVVAVISSTITSFATSNYLFDSIDVKYNNSNGVQAETVQGAIDELYSCASDYSSMNTRINTLEGYFDNKSYILGNNTAGIDLNVKNNTISSPWIHMFYEDDLVGDIWANKDDGLNISSSNNKLNIQGNPVKINGKSFTSKWDLLGGACSLNTSNDTNYTISNINSYILLRINASYYSRGLPDFGGVTISVDEFKAANQEAIFIFSSFDFSFKMTVKYVNDTTISVRQYSGSSSSTACFSVHGVL